MTIWTTPAGFLGTVTERVSTVTYVVTNGSNITIKLISGGLPSGLTISNTGTISGTPDAVLNTTNNKFVLRASQLIGSTITNYDRTFNIDVFGPSVPTWNTNEGFVAAGYNNQQYVLNNMFVDFNFSASSINSPDGTQLSYYVADGDGLLPPGLKLDSSGRLYGILRDKLTFDGGISLEGGYDSDSYDVYTYDHSSTTSTQITGVPKFYKFYVTADDGIATNKRLFSILVVNPNMFKVDNTNLIYNTATFHTLSTTLPSSISSLQVPQFINGSDLGTVRAGNNHEMDVTAYDPSPYAGDINYSITEGVDPLTKLPTGLYIDSTVGFIYGFIPYQPAYTRTYSLTINATKFNGATQFVATATNVFTLKVAGEVESTIEWVSTSSLGTIYAGEISEVSVKAQQINSNYNIKYTLVNGNLPAGLTLEQGGSISGRPEYASTGTYSFVVKAEDVYGLSAITKTFTLDVELYDSKEYTQIYVRPFLPLSQRTDYQSFITNTFTFDPSLMYRYFDPNFGVQNNIKMYLEFGIEKLNLASYMPALSQNFYRKKLYFGDVKVAVARDDTGAIIYEVVYVDIIDDQVNHQGDSVSPVIYNVNDILYPNSIDNMKSSLEHIVLPDYVYISTNKDSLPKFMNTAQGNEYKPPGYMRVVPLCYALPGQGFKIISRIKLANFDFKTMSFEVDRLIIQNNLDSSTAKYVIFARQNISDKLETDDILYGPDYEFMKIGVDLQTENLDPLRRV